MDVKRIKFERTGGFAGLRIATDFELADLPAEQAKELRELLDDVDFEELPEQLLGKKEIPDGFNYSVTVESRNRKHTVHTTDTSAPEKMQPLLELLYRIARQRASKK